MYNHIFVAGTFDHLHSGHEAVLIAAFRKGKTVTVGLTSDAFVKMFKKQKSSAYIVRKQRLLRWLVAKKYDTRAEIIPIDDPYEPAASDLSLDAIIVTASNKKRGKKINIKRQARALRPLALVEVSLIPAEDQKVISSTRIRSREIDRDGKLVLPDALRPELQQPLGQVLHGDMITRSLAAHKDDLLISVGDMTTKTLLDAGVVPSLIIIDNKVGRKPFRGLVSYRHILKKSIAVKSGPGFISKEAQDSIRAWHPQPLGLVVIEVDGEEDLLTLPAVAYAPVRTVVYYGQPPVSAWACGPVIEGMVEVIVTKEKKQEVKKLLQQFTNPDQSDQ